ncbi:hypothetical protein BC936DRAFT_144826 [Jimgerdemannia flammicorona]|uniref:NADP-dependent oxidoreductase domain-containing protein n=1 Tax=Jimgerdemannia flammicorona TaxID=994334 RepID=A0A433DBI7_9FUNG|nr:hypothetical protein BC936DRAFT_144826 [Jimgerdemannia flammicorona]
MLERIGQTFEALEEEVAKGTIRSYGISSNSFSVPPEDPHFLPYHSLVELARSASRKVSGDPEVHGFAAIQMPGNFLEQEGLKVTAKWAKKNGLKVFINRPLNAFNQDGAFRLASYPPPNPPYASVLSQTVAQPPLSDLPPTHFLSQLINELDSTLPRLTSVFDYESIHHQVYRFLRSKSNEMHPEWLRPLQLYLDAHEQEVRYRGSRSVEQFLEARGIELPPEEGVVGGRIERFALEFLAEDEGVDCVLLGVTKERYVEVAREVMRSVAEEEGVE